MPRFQVSFMIKDWVQVSVDADDEKSAKEKAEKKLEEIYSAKSGTECIDGTTTYIGCLNESELDIN